MADANGDRQGRALSMRHQAWLLRASGDYDDAVRLLQQAIAIETEIEGSGLATGLEALAGVGIDQGRAAFAATLFGAAEVIRTSGGPFRRPDESPGYEADIAALRASLERSKLESAWARGAALSTEQAVRLALENAVGEPPGGPDLLAGLTRSERRIVEMVAQGLSSRQIGEELGISERTVQGHVGRALSKLNLTSRNQLRGLIPGPDEGPPL